MGNSMKIRCKVVLGILSAFVSTLVAADCLDVQGQVQTQSISSQVQVGSLTMAPVINSQPHSILNFSAVFGQHSLSGGIRGEIIQSASTSTTLYLNHEIGIPGIGSLVTNNDRADIISFDSTNGIATVKESLSIVGAQNEGMFAGWTGTLVADGVLDIQKGINTFSYSGQICKRS